MFQSNTQDSSLQITNIEELRRQVGMGLMLMIALGGTIYNTFSLVTNQSLSTTSQYLAFGIAGVSLFAFFLLRRRILVRFVLHVPIFLLLGSMYFSPTEFGFPVTSVATIVIASLIAQFPVYVMVGVLIIGSAIYRQQLSPEYPYLIYGVSAILISSITYYAIFYFSRFIQQSGRTNRLLHASSDIAQVINLELELQQLLDNTVNTIRDEFNFYHVQVFLIDDKYEYANLVASTGEAGKQLLARNHRLPVGSQSVIGRVTQVGEPVITQNTTADTVHALNELLPDTRAELALPIIDSSNIVGALDVQSIHADAFQPIDIQALQIISNQLSVAIRNARLFEQAQQNIQENKQLLFEYETNLRQLDRLNRSLTQQSWDNYLTYTTIDGVTLSDKQLQPRAEWSAIMNSAAEKYQTQVDDNGKTQTIAVPIILRDQVLGAIEIELDSGKGTSDSIEMLQSISQRLAISLESARLFEETQEATLQEQQINEIVSNYETATSIDDLLQVTLKELQQALGAEKGVVRLSAANTSTSNHQHNGNGGSPA